jgi:hypothetical protein
MFAVQAGKAQFGGTAIDRPLGFQRIQLIPSTTSVKLSEVAKTTRELEPAGQAIKQAQIDFKSFLFARRLHLLRHSMR